MNAPTPGTPNASEGVRASLPISTPHTRIALRSLLHTELGWFGFGRVPSPAERIIADSGLPDSHRALITRIVKRTRLWRRERADVARELVAHFADGLGSGASEKSLIDSFGHETRAARLIRRAKRRNRGIVWQAWINSCRAFACIFLLLFAVYLYFGIRVWTAEPQIKRNYLAELNAPAEAVPPEDRGWPLLREAILARTEPWEVLTGGDPPSETSVDDVTDDPDSPHWPQFIKYVEVNERALDLVRAAAAKPRLAYRLGVDDDAELQIKRGHIRLASQYVPPPECQELLSVLLPHLGECRYFARMLRAEAIAAAKEGRDERVLENIGACIRMAQQVRESQVLICDLVALSLLSTACDTLGHVLQRSPDALTEEQWRDAAHRLVAFDQIQPLRLNLVGERASFHDMLQRLYTDDGRGGGLMAAGSVRYLERLQRPDPSAAWTAIGFATRLLDPFPAAYFADRREITSLYDRLMDHMESKSHLPLWQQPHADEVEESILRVTGNDMLSARYMPIRLLMPALGRVQTNFEWAIQVRDAALTAIALELFRRDHGRYPNSLGELVPAFLPAVPPDRHTGRPLNYALKDGKPILYSVGIDLDDDGGAPPPDRPHAIRWSANHVSRWRHPVEVARIQRERPNELPDGDWILFPPSPAR